MTAISSITEEELHAYLDGELPDAQRASVEAYLREHPDDARLLEAYLTSRFASASMVGSSQSSVGDSGRPRAVESSARRRPAPSESRP